MYNHDLIFNFQKTKFTYTFLVVKENRVLHDARKKIIDIMLGGPPFFVCFHFF